MFLRNHVCAPKCAFIGKLCLLKTRINLRLLSYCCIVGSIINGSSGDLRDALEILLSTS